MNGWISGQIEPGAARVAPSRAPAPTSQQMMMEGIPYYAFEDYKKAFSRYLALREAGVKKGYGEMTRMWATDPSHAGGGFYYLPTERWEFQDPTTGEWSTMKPEVYEDLWSEASPDVWVKTGDERRVTDLPIREVMLGFDERGMPRPLTEEERSNKYLRTSGELGGGVPSAGGAYPFLRGAGIAREPTDWAAIYERALPKMPSPAMEQYYEGQYAPLYREYRATALPEEPTGAGFEAFMKQYPFLEKYGQIPPRQRGEFTARFRPPTRWLNY